MEEKKEFNLLDELNKKLIGKIFFYSMTNPKDYTDNYPVIFECVIESIKISEKPDSLGEWLEVLLMNCNIKCLTINGLSDINRGILTPLTNDNYEKALIVNNLLINCSEIIGLHSIDNREDQRLSDYQTRLELLYIDKFDKEIKNIPLIMICDMRGLV